MSCNRDPQLLIIQGAKCTLKCFENMKDDCLGGMILERKNLGAPCGGISEAILLARGVRKFPRMLSIYTAVTRGLRPESWPRIEAFFGL
jgi:hypothetical protein